MLNYAFCREGILGSGGIVPGVLKLGSVVDVHEWSRLRSVSLTTGIHRMRGWVSPRVSLKTLDKGNKASVWVIEVPALGCPARSCK
jgi:hypothetical protein